MRRNERRRASSGCSLWRPEPRVVSETHACVMKVRTSSVSFTAYAVKLARGNRSGQLLLDRGNETRIVGEHLRPETGDHGAVAVDQELLEVPGDVAALALLVRSVDQG